ncbi:hypothetical protein BJ165DRAFT_1399800 [Panaeolus papilionaceus]|nr:hypothetical protein BJ165DRAFT_1399800 [Panaeolus papilionaceus]
MSRESFLGLSALAGVVVIAIGFLIAYRFHWWQKDHPTVADKRDVSINMFRPRANRDVESLPLYDAPGAVVLDVGPPAQAHIAAGPTRQQQLVRPTPTAPIYPPTPSASTPERRDTLPPNYSETPTSGFGQIS